MKASLASSIALELPWEEQERLISQLTIEELEALAADANEQIRGDFFSFCLEALRPLELTPARHQRLLIDQLQQVADGKIPRLMITMPPGSAKSTYTSTLFPAWVMARRKRINIIGASNTADLAEDFSRATMDIVRRNSDILGYGLDRESAEMWTTTTGGRYRAAGVGGTIAGRRADGALIDDPIRSRADAESEVARNKQWAWAMADLRSRLKPGAWIVLIMTRWHRDDLGGRFLERQPGLWKVISLPAQAIAEPSADELAKAAIRGEHIPWPDPLGREPGEWLWTDDEYGYGAELAKVKAEYEQAGAMRDWAALYQQTPIDAEGAIFKIGKIGLLEEMPKPAGIGARGWDLAATKDVGTRNPDWTAGVRMHRMPDGRFLVMNVHRTRGGPEDTEAEIINTTKLDGHGIKVGIPQDPGQAGKTQVAYLTKKLSGYVVESSPESGDKATRAMPFASQVNVGNVLLLRGDWNAAYLDELAAFDGSGQGKDDQVDASSRAFSMISDNAPMRISAAALARARGGR